MIIKSNKSFIFDCFILLSISCCLIILSRNCSIFEVGLFEIGSLAVDLNGLAHQGLRIFALIVLISGGRFSIGLSL